MSVKNELGHLIESFRLFMSGSEPNVIPQAGLTLDEACLRSARKWLERSPDEYYRKDVITAFESAMADYCGQEEIISFSSGRAALLAILRSLDIGKGDKVLLPGYTCLAVANSVWFSGAQPVFYDIDLDDYGPDLKSIKAISEENDNLRAIVVQHTYGIMGGQLEEVIPWARERKLTVIEDCAHALGSRYNGRMAGQFGDAAFFSSERSKCISTFQGGWACAAASALRQKLRNIQSKAEDLPADTVQRYLEQFIFTYLTERDPSRWYKRPILLLQNKGKYIPGVNDEEMRKTIPDRYLCKMAAPMAELGTIQTGKIEWANEVRRRRAEEWHDWARAKGFDVPVISEGSNPAFLSYPVLVAPEQKKDLAWSSYLRAEIGKWYVSHLHPSDHAVENCPNAEEAVKRCINLPTNVAVVV